MKNNDVPTKKIEILYAELKNKYVHLQRKFKIVILAFKKSRIAFKRLLKRRLILKKKYIIIKKHSNKKVMELIEKINKDKYQLIFDENKKLIDVSNEFLTEIEMEKEEFSNSFYIDILFEKYLPQPGRKSQSINFEPFQFPIMLKNFQS